MRRLSYAGLDAVRRITQLLSLAFLFAVPLLILLGTYRIVGSLYSISIGGLVIADPAMALQTVLLTRDIHLPLLFAVAIPVVVALIFGRVFCSWVCPYNTLAEWTERARRRVRGKSWQKKRLARAAANPHPGLYWGIFAGLLLTMLIVGLPLLSYLSLPGMLSVQISHGVLGQGLGLELAIIAVLLVAEVGSGRRLWCKYACPVGATLALCRTRRTLHIAHDAGHCSCPMGGEACRPSCPIGLAPNRDGLRPFCLNCGSCLVACETTRRGALQFRFSHNGTVPLPSRMEV
jgi:ferredoxin-type protein NapH